MTVDLLHVAYSDATVTSACDFPACPNPPVTPAGMCAAHRNVAVSSTGTWVPDRHTTN